MTAIDIFMIIANIGTFIVGFGLGFWYGFDGRQKVIAVMKQAPKPRPKPRKVRQPQTSAIVEDRKIVRKDKPVESSDSQIVGTKSREEVEDERAQARDRKLDKWMPGVKHG